MSQFCEPCAPLIEKENGNENEEESIPPSQRNITPHDVIDIKDDDDSIVIIGTRGSKVTRLTSLKDMRCLSVLTLRSCLISSTKGIESPNLITLTKLELYDNQIEDINGIQSLTNLIILDLSYNGIRDMSPVSNCILLEELYIAQNKLRKIEGLNNMQNLRILDLGANRIRLMEGLDNLTSLQSLWLGKNKIETIACIGNLPKLRQLDIQNNRITSIGEGQIQNLGSLEELYLACNAIEIMDNFPINSPLGTLDLSYNKIISIQGVELLTNLEELWMTKSLLESYDDLAPLTKLSGLKCLYLEHSPVAKDFEYRMRLTKLIPTLEQLDATAVTRWNK